MKQNELKVLVLEDESYRRELIQPLLDNHQVSWAKNSVEALKFLDLEKFDLILLDHDLADNTCGCSVASRLADPLCLNHKTKVVVHSINPIGIKRMMKLLSNMPVRIPVFSLPEDLPQVLMDLPMAA